MFAGGLCNNTSPTDRFVLLVTPIRLLLLTISVLQRITKSSYTCITGGIEKHFKEVYSIPIRQKYIHVYTMYAIINT